MEAATLPSMNVHMNQSGPGGPRVEHFLSDCQDREEAYISEEEDARHAQSYTR